MGVGGCAPKTGSVTGGTISPATATISTGDAVALTFTASPTFAEGGEGTVTYEWLLTGESDGLTLTWKDNVATVGGMAPVVEVSGVCNVTCKANGVALTPAVITVNQLAKATKKK